LQIDWPAIADPSHIGAGAGADAAFVAHDAGKHRVGDGREHHRNPAPALHHRLAGLGSDAVDQYHLVLLELARNCLGAGRVALSVVTVENDLLALFKPGAGKPGGKTSLISVQCRMGGDFDFANAQRRCGLDRARQQRTTCHERKN